MKSPKEKLVEFMKIQIMNENAIVKSVAEGTGNINNPPVKAVLKGISLDSTKHAELYSSAIALLTSFSQAMLWFWWRRHLTNETRRSYNQASGHRESYNS